MNSDLRIVFMGTPDFAVESLNALLKNNFNVVGVITAPDKPAGRGMKIQYSAVKEYALKNNLNLLQPEKLKSPEFIYSLKALLPDLQVVVAFRMLPEIVWNMPRFGTFNLHASLLPHYRGAAPINWAIINGEKETGITTFFINQNIDTGDIIFSEKVSIGDDETAGELHDRLMTTGAELVVKTVKTISEGNLKIQKQELILSAENIKSAPKLFKENCKINWNQDLDSIHNLIRGLSPYPAAFTELVSPENKTFLLKIFKCSKEKTNHDFSNGKILTDHKVFFKIAVKGGFISLLQVQLEGRKKMSVSEFLRGFHLNEEWKF